MDNCNSMIITDESRANTLGIRRANLDDKSFLFHLRNDESVRQLSSSSRPIDAEEHEKWYAKALTENDVLIFILCEATIPVGYLRGTLKSINLWELSWAIIESKRGKGLGSWMLKHASSLFNGNLMARIILSNEPSQRAAMKAGFLMAGTFESQQYWVFPKKNETFTLFLDSKNRIRISWKQDIPMLAIEEVKEP